MKNSKAFLALAASSGLLNSLIPEIEELTKHQWWLVKPDITEKLNELKSLIDNACIDLKNNEANPKKCSTSTQLTAEEKQLIEDASIAHVISIHNKQHDEPWDNDDEKASTIFIAGAYWFMDNYNKSNA